MYSEIGPRVTHDNTLSVITLQNIIPDLEMKVGNNLVSFLCT